ncbi:adenylyl-sulfate kinase [Romboutsia sedimentorum]|uniref:Adenylyl-sulfate kinase n=1 Tax=Romboutsia sedimentorum TaxID=1368474 RepID=A0ABT7E9B8_9FIRM|nr:adenylyl-sulfate kinase [Romboutsia sedimentorum]MDK2562688.1 adenylyl-sulfate kinase [Romboutsia sedimentorum]
MKGTVYWVTGLAGAGKTTIGKLLYESIKSNKDNVILLDGDKLRALYESDDYSYDGRKKLASKYSRLCKMISGQGIDVICCTIAMFDECRKWNRDNILNYKEIYLKVSIDELIKRDQKGLYSRALKKEITNVMGIDIDFEEPKMPDILIYNNGEISPNDVLNNILLKLNK